MNVPGAYASVGASSVKIQVVATWPGEDKLLGRCVFVDLDTFLQPHASFILTRDMNIHFDDVLEFASDDHVFAAPWNARKMVAGKTVGEWSMGMVLSPRRPK